MILVRGTHDFLDTIFDQIKMEIEASKTANGDTPNKIVFWDMSREPYFITKNKKLIKETTND